MRGEATGEPSLPAAIIITVESTYIPMSELFLIYNHPRIENCIGFSEIGMTSSFKISLLLAGAAVALMATNSQPAHAACPALPDVPWWTNSPDKVANFVERRHKGDWGAYIKKWAKYGKNMQGIYDREGTALVKSRDLRLQGDRLKDYIGKISQRVSALKCLATETKSAEKTDGTDLNKFSTASGGGEEIALAPRRGKDGPNYSVEVNARCDGTNTIFEVVNLVSNWLGAAAVGVYRVREVGIVEKQVRRLASKQRLTMRVAPERGRGVEQLGVWVQPSWLLRDFQFDAQITCN
jgi:hypothetical protein